MLIAFDPGRNLGVAIVSDDGRLLSGRVTNLADLPGLPLPEGATVLVGAGTGSGAVRTVLTERGFSPVSVDERSTTLEARELYFRDHPPRGLARLIPRGMRFPARDIDDYAAYAIALRWLAAKSR